MLRRLTLLLCCSLSLQLFAQSDTIVYSVVTGGNIKGFSKIWKNADGSFESWYQFNDRGRGDSMRTWYRQDEEGFPVAIKASGVDYMKNPVSEEFSVSNGKARWKNQAEDEEQDIIEKVFYTGLKASGGDMGKALRKNKNRIKLLPFGEVQMRTVATHQLKKEGNAKTVSLMEMRGFGFMPTYGWDDEAGENFANVSEWSSTIRSGYEWPFLSC